ncbi:MAG: Na+/H+ antiporter subunit E [Paracoccus sp. (in: a-proteobacteria)]|nr:Na+/H+ antiporter subunit E [Paracoccus sp. (in: a-proteobacteria)]
MNIFVLNLLLALIWSALHGDSSIQTLATGFFLGMITLWLIRPLIGGGGYYFRRFLAWVKLIVLFMRELIMSNISVARDIIRPRSEARPQIIEMPLDVKTDAGILLLTNLITLTPGTLTLDVSDDRKTAIIHAMFCSDPDEEIAGIKATLERWVIDAVEAHE